MTRSVLSMLLLLLAPLLASAHDSLHHSDCEQEGNVTNPYPLPDDVAPDVFQVEFNTSVKINGVAAEPIVLEVHREWAPLGADRFHSLVHDHFYVDAAFFRVVPGFIVQFGIAADPNITAKWDTPIVDDPVRVSNRKWTLSFATSGADTRTTQIFINVDNNQAALDHQGFAPFAKVISGFDTVLAVVNPTPGNENGVDQVKYTMQGNEWLLAAYPNVSLIKCEGQGHFAEEAPASEESNLDYMLIYSFVSLSIVVAAIILLFYVRRKCCYNANMRESDHIRLMDFSTGSEA